MSSNQTTNYGLHQWQPGDTFLRSEINENFGLLDHAVQLVCGSYTGDGTTVRTIELGFRPRVVIVLNSDGIFNTTAGVFGGVASEATSTSNLAAAETGFVLAPTGNSYAKVNLNNQTYSYLALQ